MCVLYIFIIKISSPCQDYYNIGWPMLLVAHIYVVISCAGFYHTFFIDFLIVFLSQQSKYSHL